MADKPIKTPEQIAAIRERAEKATPGPWGYDLNHTVAQFSRHRDWDESVLQLPWGARGRKPTDREKANAEFAASARTDIPELCDSHTAQAQRIAELRDAASDRIAAVISETVTAYMEKYRAEFVLKEPNMLVSLQSELSSTREALAQERARTKEALEALDWWSKNPKVTIYSFPVFGKPQSHYWQSKVPDVWTPCQLTPMQSLADAMARATDAALQPAQLEAERGQGGTKNV